MTVAETIAEAALSYVGTPFHHQGRRPGVGLDCVGVLACALHHAGYRFIDVPGYPKMPPSRLLLDSLRKNGFQEVSRRGTALGDVVAFWVLRSGPPVHCGIMTAKGVVHVLDSERVKLMRRMTGAWSRRIHSVWRVA